MLLCTIKRINGGYILYNPSNIQMTSIIYLQTDDIAINYFNNFISTWPNWGLRKEII